LTEAWRPYFRFNRRLGIELPDPDMPFENLPRDEQEAVLMHWETLKPAIANRIRDFERRIEDLLFQIHLEDDWDAVVQHFDKITEYASCINELNSWLRVDPQLPPAR
jgi:hypothetical protein